MPLTTTGETSAAAASSPSTSSTSPPVNKNAPSSASSAVRTNAKLNESPSAMSLPSANNKNKNKNGSNQTTAGGGGAGGLPSASNANSASAKKQKWTWQRLVETLLCQGGDDSGETLRIVCGANPQANAQFKYCDNSIKTSRYNVFTFLPLNLFEQFLRFANVYFLALVILQAFDVISPYSPVSTAAALAFVLGVTAVKDGVDDIYRHKSDDRINNRKASVLAADSTLKTVRWHQIAVGQIVMLKNNEHVPADLLLLSSSDSSGLCFIETAELDGETNLKYRQALVQTQPLGNDLKKLGSFDGKVECEPPNNHLTRFEGRLDYLGQTLSLNNNAILLRGCTIRNTAWAAGIVIFTGRETKLMKNSGKSIYKRTRIDRLANKFLLSIFVFLLTLIIIAAILGYVFESGIGTEFKDAYSLWMNISGINPSLIGFLQFFSYLILLQTLIPISLYVTFEIIRIMLSSGYINADLEMYHAPNDTPAVARTTTLNEELGQIAYIFSDKTGTLTQNIMTFNKCTIAGKMYGDARELQSGKVVPITSKNAARFRLDFSNHEKKYWEKSFQFFDKALLDDVKRGAAEVHDFFLLIALCHTINAEYDDNGVLVYNAQSPDEAALVSAARNFGFVYKSRSPSSITVEVMGVERTYEMLCILDFDNVRKRMSVIVEKDGRRRLLCKGADTCILELLKDGQRDMVDKTKAHLNEFAGSGLRTLCCAVRDIDDAEWARWNTRYKHASTTLDDRESRIYECYLDIEKNLTLIGATAVEDKLQEGVPETIYNLSKAGIKIWVLTGDKQETAINIGYSCNMLRDTMEEFIIDADDFVGVERQLRRMREQIDIIEKQIGEAPYTIPSIPMATVVASTNGVRTTAGAANSGDNYALIINGHSLYHALTEDLEDLFLSVACACQAVICCRVAPLQKGRVVDLVKRKKKAITLSIGDGANDVNMIKTAHIGVGISGQEGMQAVLSSDFSFAQFRFLQRLLLVHGRWAYLRVAIFLRYFFYKNFAFTLGFFWFAIYCGWSAAPLYDQWFITFYNIVYTSTPIINYAWVEQDVNAYYSQAYPRLYYPGPRDLSFNLPFFILALAEGTYASAVTFFFMRYGFAEYAMPSGHSISTSMSALGVAQATAIGVIVNVRCCLEMSHWTAFNVFPALSIIAVFVIQILIGELLAAFKVEFEFFGIVYAVWGSPGFWLSAIAATAACCLPAVFIRYLNAVVRRPLVYRAQMRQHVEKKRPEEYNQLAIRRGASALRRSRMGSGFAFSQQSGFGSMISAGVLRESTSRPSTTSAKKVNPAVKRNSVGQAPPSSGDERDNKNNKSAPGSADSDTSRAKSKSSDNGYSIA